MFAIQSIAAITGLVWIIVGLVRSSLLAGCFVLLLATICFGRRFFALEFGPLPLSIDRLFVFGLIALYFVQRFLGRYQPRKLRISDYILFAFIALISVSTFQQDFLGSRVGSAAPIWRLLLGYWIPALVYWIAGQSQLSDRRLTRFYYLLAAVGVYLAITGLLEITKQWAFVFPRYIADPSLGIHYGRARGPMLSGVHYGMCVAICTFVSWTLMRRMSRPGIVIVLSLSTVFFLAIYFSYTRSVWLGTALGIGMLAFFAFDVGVRPLLLVFVLLMAIVLSIFNSDFLLAMQRESSAEATRRSSMNRVVFAYVSWQMFRDRPLLGCGFGNFPVEKMNYLADRDTELHLESIRDYAHHNTFLSLLTEVGAIGLTLFVALLASWVRVAILLLRTSSPEWVRGHGALLLACLGVYVAQLAFHELSYSQLPNMSIFLMAGIAAGLQPIAEAAREAAPGLRVETRAGKPNRAHQDINVLAPAG